MKLRLILPALLCLGLQQSAAQPAIHKQHIQQHIQQLSDSIAGAYLSNPDNHGMAIGILQKKQRHLRYYGGKYAQATKDIDSTSLFEIGSVSKLYTSYILAALETEGKLRRSDLLASHLPAHLSKGKAWAGKIRLVDLSTHTSGLPGYDDTKSLKALPGFDENDPYGLFDEKLLLELLAKTDTLDGYGKVRYSNFGVGLLGHVMARSQKTDFRTLFERYISQPMALKDTYLQAGEGQLHRLAMPHRKGETMPLIQLSALAPAGAIKTTMADLLRFLEFHLYPDQHSRAITNISLADQLGGKPQAIGLGWGIHQVDGQKVYFHNGGTYGSSSIVLLCPARDIAIAILANDATEGQLTGYALKLLKTLGN